MKLFSIDPRLNGLSALLLVLLSTGAAQGDTLFVTNYLTGSVGEYTTSGAVVNASLVTGLTGPYGIAVSGEDLFIADRDAGTIREYTTSGALVDASLISGLGNTWPIAVSGSNLFVADGIGSIREYTTSGALVNASLITGVNPSGIVVSGSDLFVANFGNGFGTGSISEYTTSGAVVNKSLITGLTDITNVAVSGSNLFVVNNAFGTIGEYTTSGATVNASLMTGLSDPEGIAIAASAPDPTPEPGTIALLGIGLAAFAMWKKTRPGTPTA